MPRKSGQKRTGESAPLLSAVDQSQYYQLGDPVAMPSEPTNHASGLRVKSLSELLTKANANENTVVDKINGPKSIVATKSQMSSHLVKEGRIGLYEHNSRICAVGPGRWWLGRGFNRARWQKEFSLTDTDTTLQQLSVFRVPKGKLGLAMYNGSPMLLDEGYHVYNDPLFTFSNHVDINQNYIHHGNLHFIRVPRGYMAKIKVDNKPYLLEEGEYGFDELVFEFSGQKKPPTNASLLLPKRPALVDQPISDAAQDLQTQTHHQLREQRLTRARKEKQLREVSIKENAQACHDHLSQNAGCKFVSSNDYIIGHDTLSRIIIPEGYCAKVMIDGKPKLITEEGQHTFNTPLFQFDGFESLAQKVIEYQTITRFQVSKGEVALVWEENQPKFLDKPDVYQFESSHFRYEMSVDATDPIIELGSRKRIMVRDGEAGVSYKNGVLHILEKGTHDIDDAQHRFEDIVTTKQQSELLSSAKSRSRDLPADMMSCETKDLVNIGVKAEVFYRIRDPAKVVREVGIAVTESGLRRYQMLVRDTAIATLIAIIRSTSLNEIAQSKEPSTVPVPAPSQAFASDRMHPVASLPYGQLQDSAELTAFAAPSEVMPAMTMQQPSAPTFFDKVHDDFINRLHDDFMNRYGIEITNIRIENLQILNTELAQSISKQAERTADTEAKLATLEGQTRIQVQEAERKSQIAKLDADTKAYEASAKCIKEAEASLVATQNRQQEEQLRNQIQVNKAEAEARAKELIASAEAKAIEVKAAAEAKAIEMVGEAKAKAAKSISDTPIGMQLALLEKMNEGLMATLANTKKMVVVPEKMMENPYGLFAMMQQSGSDAMKPVFMPSPSSPSN